MFNSYVVQLMWLLHLILVNNVIDHKGNFHKKIFYSNFVTKMIMKNILSHSLKESERKRTPKVNTTTHTSL